MQEILQILFPYLVFFYLADCTYFVNNRQLLFVSGLGRGYQVRNPGFVLGGCLPWSHVFSVERLPSCFSPHGFFCSNQTFTGNYLYKVDDFLFLAYEDISFLHQDGRKMIINKKLVHETSSVSSAAKMIATMRYRQELDILPIRDGGAPDRQNLTKALVDLRKALSFHSKFLGGLKLLSTALFFQCFILLPLALYSPWAPGINLLLLLVRSLALNYVLVVAFAIMLHGKICAGSAAKRVHFFLILLCSPVTTIRAAAYLFRYRLEEVDFVVVAAALLSKQKFQELVRRDYVRAAHAAKQSEEKEWHSFWENRTKEIENLLDSMKISLHHIKRPMKSDLQSVYYCPLCLAEYLTDNGTCHDCGIDLLEI